MHDPIPKGKWGDDVDFRSKNNNLLLTALQFTSQDGQDLLESLSPFPAGQELHIFDTRIVTDNPLLCVAYECYQCFESWSRKTQGETAKLLQEMACLLDEMISNHLGSRFWSIAESTAPQHLFWQILQRLSRLTLASLGWNQGKPKIDLAEFITVGRWVSKKGPGIRTSRNAFGALLFDETGFYPPLIEGDTMTVEAMDVGLRPEHPWYVKPVLEIQYLKKCKLIFRGIKLSERQISILEEGAVREVHTQVDIRSASKNTEAINTESFRLTGTMMGPDTLQVGQEFLRGHVEWTVEATEVELIDEDWRGEES